MSVRYHDRGARRNHGRNVIVRRLRSRDRRGDHGHANFGSVWGFDAGGVSVTHRKATNRGRKIDRGTVASPRGVFDRRCNRARFHAEQPPSGHGMARNHNVTASVAQAGFKPAANV
jgi:hypothetical protein